MAPLSGRIPGCIPALLLVFTMFSGISFSQDTSISKRIPVPPGFARQKYSAGSFSNFVQSLPIKKTNQITLFNGTSMEQAYPLQYAGYRVFAVVNIPLLFNSDLEQCADYCMRFWAEYHKTNNNLGKLFLFDYNGNKKQFASSGKSYTGFLKWAFSYSNSFSIKKGCVAIVDTGAVPGDMIVQNEGGGIGHVSMIVDRCENATGSKRYLIGYGFMPAQEFHIEKASDKYGTGGWFSLEGYFKYLDENLNLGKPVLRRFNPL
jgi:hypothetical protein